MYIYLVIIDTSYFKEFFISNIESKYISKFNNTKKMVYSYLNKMVSTDYLDYKVSDVVKIIDTTEEEVKVNKPIIYIYNTHDTEKYSIGSITDYSITPDVKIASLILKDYLNDFGIESYVQTKSIKKYLNKYNLNYGGCYRASRSYMEEASKKNDFKIYIDLHRDSSKHKYTLYKKDGKKYARVLFVLATDYKTYKQNEKFVNNLNNRINKKYKGLSRGIMKREDQVFNQDISPRAILLELGGVDNTLEEINNTLYVFARILADYINEEL